MRAHSISVLDRIPDPIRVFFGARIAELAGIVLSANLIAATLSLLSWSVLDPSIDHATSGPVHNLLGRPGAIFADLATQILGVGVAALLVPLVFWAWRLLCEHRLRSFPALALYCAAGTALFSSFASLLPVTDRWPLPTGLGGVLGDAIVQLPQRIFGDGKISIISSLIVAAIASLLCLAKASGFGATIDEFEDEPDAASRSQKQTAKIQEDTDPRIGWLTICAGAVTHYILLLRARLRSSAKPAAVDPPIMRVARDTSLPYVSIPTPAPAPRQLAREPSAIIERQDLDEAEPAQVNASTRVASVPAAIKVGKRASREAQQSFFATGQFQLPLLEYLGEPKKQLVGRISEDALEQNARLLEGVLDDFSVKGEIINVRPGPVVTLYELEPAPGIKSSRVISLADDIARSMSALSARVAVVQGRNAIGIELPNQKRETVYLRELLASEAFEKSKHRLAIALGKTIGGESEIVDLARMPHLLVAGTTGSGKSVAINTMILSLLFRLKPDQCRLIMVDPKMLELSVYDGIPHLLTPVVTDPKKAVVALKWAVREMEDRYKKMSKLGVRNIDGFNARVEDALKKGEVIRRTVQTGFDKETGEAIYEQEEMNLSVLPYIVVIVDEMADLMMVAGKDIEGAIQRLAQMARAAGIHLIMATQRPSVDVITGTIKANFPTRISFQVTSKIDSRTILGEQGAEQLLGQGDMLYMAGGGRISRVHGPFVSDAEVEKVVDHLKRQGRPEYLEDITLEDEEAIAESAAGNPDGMDAEEGGDLYDRAVNIVLRDRKCSTSYIQRRLSIGYNKAASLVERMEKEGVVGAPNHSGKREILVGGGIDRSASEFADN